MPRVYSLRDSDYRQPGLKSIRDVFDRKAIDVKPIVIKEVCCHDCLDSITSTCTVSLRARGLGTTLTPCHRPMGRIKSPPLEPRLRGPKRIVPTLTLCLRWQQKLKLGKLPAHHTPSQFLLRCPQRFKNMLCTFGFAGPLRKTHRRAKPRCDHRFGLLPKRILQR